MRNPFSENNPEDARQWFENFQNLQENQITNRLFRSNKQSDYLYNSLYDNDPELREIMNLSDKRLKLDKILQDLFTLLYSPVQQKNELSGLSPSGMLFNHSFINLLIKSDTFPKIKKLCENNELPAFSAVKAFAHLFDSISEKTHIERMMKLSETIKMLNKQCKMLSDNVKTSLKPEKQVFIINRIYKKESQIKNLKQKIKEELLKAETQLKTEMENAVKSATEAAGQTAAILSAWGSGDSGGKATEGNGKILDTVRKNDTLKQISVILGKYREILADKRKNSFSYGLGEKYDIALGNSINSCLSSELTLLGTPETEILFFQKYYLNRLQQYRKRESAKKGDGDMIVLIDESSSTREIAPWIKAFALALMDIAIHDNKKYAMIHFANSSNVRIDRFEKGKFTIDDVLKAAEHFFGGGTDFEAPLSKAIELLDDGFEKADMVMITDGVCCISDTFAENYKQKKFTHKVTVTGILLDKGGSCGDSLEPFCDEIYHTSELSVDEIALEILGQKAA